MLGVVTSTARKELHNGAEKILFKINVGFQVGEKESRMTWSVYRDEQVQTRNTGYYLLLDGLNSCVEVPKDHWCYDKERKEVRPFHWFKRGWKNEKCQAYAANAFEDERRIYVRPTEKLLAKVKQLDDAGQLSEEVPNSIDNEREVIFYKIAPSESLRLHQGTGQVPPGHDLSGLSPNQIRPVAHIQQLLNGKLVAGDFGEAK